MEHQNITLFVKWPTRDVTITGKTINRYIKSDGNSTVSYCKYLEHRVQLPRVVTAV